MKLKGINSSSKKTIKAIKEAFAELLEEKKEVSNITVTELVKKADITRGTFYSHFDSIYDIAESLESEVQDLAFSNIKKISTVEDINIFLDSVFEYLVKNKELYQKLFKSNDPIFFINRFSKKFFLALQDVLKPNDKMYKISLHFCTDGAAILLIKYFRGESEFDLNDIKNYLNIAIKKLL